MNMTLAGAGVSHNEVQSFVATIYVGLREQYSSTINPIESVQELLQSYMNSVGLCVTLTATQFIYKNGNEPGVIIGLINYPRFPASGEEIKTHALAIKELDN